MLSLAKKTNLTLIGRAKGKKYISLSGHERIKILMTNIDSQLLALIMIGGQSKRMGGGIKSFLKNLMIKILFDRILERTRPQISKMIINCNHQEEKLLKYNFQLL